MLQMELVDRAIGMVLDEIRRLGLYDDAVIVFISDHGEMNDAAPWSTRVCTPIPMCCACHL